MPRRQVDRLQLVKAIGLARKVRQADFVKDQANRFGVDEKTIKRNLDPMIATGLIVKDDDPTSGRHKLLSLDPEKGDRVVNHKGFWLWGDLKLLGESSQR
jgi:DNA-binding MarR family transcriptional regulator